MTNQTSSGSGVPATDKQLGFIRKLLVERGVTTVTEEQVLQLSKLGATRTIDKLLAMPKVKSANPWAPHPDLTVGVYMIDGYVCKVKPSQTTGNLYVSVLQDSEPGTPSTFRAKGFQFLLPKLTPAHRITAEQAKAYGDVMNHCCCCGKLLTVDESVERGVGPVCWDKYFGG